MASWKGSGEKEVAPFYKEFAQSSVPTKFEGYISNEENATILAILREETKIETANQGDDIELLVDRTPFYGESGGQVGDSGTAFNDNVQLELLNAIKPLPGLIVHKAKILNGSIKTGDSLTLRIDKFNRKNTALNHSATHLLHAALKEVLGEHIKQAGSLVAPDRLRFDYTHFSPLTEKERHKTESLVNEKIRDNIQVSTKEMEIEEALKEGALSLIHI